MKEPREDDERLSALLEGRVEGRQREEMLAHLASADDDYEVFTDTAAVLRALEEEDARARQPMPPSMRKPGWRVRVARAAAYVASAVLLVALGWTFWQARDSSTAYDPMQLAMRAEPTEDWAPWNPQGIRRGRGGGAARDARAVHAGAMLVDLSAAILGRDSAQMVVVLATRLDDLVDVGANEGTPLQQIAARPQLPADSLNALLKQATARLRQDLPHDPLELGAWAEAARLAATAQTATFFADGASDGMLKRADRLARGDADAEAAVAQVRQALPGNGATNWQILADRLGTMLSALVN